jgi:predicted TIM-barrel fold metal-dependent hydrolase
LKVDAPLVAERHSRPARDVPVEEFLSTLDRHGITYGVLTAPSFYGPDNSVLLAALRAYPNRLRGTVIVDPEADTDLDQLAEAGVVGIRLNWIRRERLPDITSPAYAHLLADISARGWHVELFLEGGKLADVLPAIQNSGAKLVLDHFGCPDPAGGIASHGFRLVLDAVRAGNCWVKLSAPYRLGGADPQRYVDALLQAGGPQRLVWASDWPFVGHETEISYQNCIDWLTGWIPDEATRQLILADVPLGLFGFPRF